MTLPETFGDCKANTTSVMGFEYDHTTLKMKFKQVKSDTSKCFRLKSTETKVWEPLADYNYYPVCYEYKCIEAPESNLTWKIEVSIGSTTVTCTEQG